MERTPLPAVEEGRRREVGKGGGATSERAAAQGWRRPREVRGGRRHEVGLRRRSTSRGLFCGRARSRRRREVGASEGGGARSEEGGARSGTRWRRVVEDAWVVECLVAGRVGLWGLGLSPSTRRRWAGYGKLACWAGHLGCAEKSWAKMSYLFRDFRDFRVLTLHSRISHNNFGKSDHLPEKAIGIFGFGIFGFGFGIFGFRVRESGNMPTLTSD